MSRTSDLARSEKLLEQLGWTWAGQRLAELIEQAVREKLSLHAFLERVAEAEHAARETHRVAGWLKRSGLPVGKTLENFDFTFAHGVDRRKVELLATCEFATRHETILVLGPSGVGKTHLAAGVGVKAVANGFSVWFVTADALIEMLRRDEQAPAARIRQRRYLTAKVLVIDELGFQTLDRGDAHTLFRLINHHYERASTIITSNKSIRDWPTMLAGDEALTTAILDRLLHHCHVLSIDGASYRLRHLEQQLGERE
ncbi:MAG: IS21-like element helper ATPase IstB [Phycisphaeraceae bacterium]